MWKSCLTTTGEVDKLILSYFESLYFFILFKIQTDDFYIAVSGYSNGKFMHAGMRNQHGNDDSKQNLKNFFRNVMRRISG